MLQNTWTRLGAVLVGFLTVTQSLRAEVVVGQRREIFASKEAADLVISASTKTDRDEAVALIEKAIALQAGAKVNAHLAACIARCYAYYGDRAKGAPADLAKAAHWWERAIELSNPSQFLWAEAQANLGSARFLMGDPRAAAKHFMAVLALDLEKMELPDWRQWPVAGSHEAERELANVRRLAETARLKAIDNAYYALARFDGAEAAKALAQIAKTYKGTPAGDHATQLLGKALSTPSSSICRYRGLPEALSKELAGICGTEMDVIAGRGRQDGGSTQRGSSGDPDRGAPPFTSAAQAKKGSSEAKEPSASSWRSWPIVAGCVLVPILVVGLSLCMWRVKQRHATHAVSKGERR